MRYDFPKLVCPLLLGLLAAGGCLAFCAADEPATGESNQSAAQRAAKLFASLDDDCYDVRAAAAAEFERLMQRPELRSALAAAVQQALIEPQLSFEARWHLTRWAKRLPPADSPPAPEPATEEVDRLVDGLDADDYGQRLAAGTRLQWYLGNPKVTGPVLTRLKIRYADPGVDSVTRMRMEQAWQIARGTVLVGDPAVLALAPASDEQIDHWLGAYSLKALDDKNKAACRAAEMELLDQMANDAVSPRVVQAAVARLEVVADPDDKARLEKLIELAKPALVAEYWTGREHWSEQHLLVGVPSLSPNALRPSHFDRIDDQTAHCVSGNSLAPGNYPANVAFLHPRGDAFFRLVNLPTPRRRMAYGYQSKVDSRVRLAQISRQTLDRFLAEKRPLTDQELALLVQLDQREVSRFASAWLMQMDDKPVFGDIDRHQIGGRPSRHGMLCVQLALEGTQEAVPGLIEAIEKERFLPPTSAAPYRLQYLAALAIAQRDPWNEVDAWLASQLDSARPLADNARPDGPTVGATAANVLLKRYDQPPAQFGLQPTADGTLLQFNLDGYRFTTPEGAASVRKFLRAQQEKGARP